MSRKYCKLSFLFSITTLIFCLIPLNVKGLEDNKSFISIADSFVDEGHPDSDFGGYTYLKVGYSNNWTKTYIKFDLLNAPKNFHKAELRIAFLYVENTTLLDFYQSNSSWSEYSITWNNAPPFGDLIASESIHEYVELHKHIKIDITDNLENVTGFWSIGINSSIQKLVRIAPKEHPPPPILMFYYQTSDLFMFGKIGLVGSIGLVIVGVVLYQIRKKKR